MVDGTTLFGVCPEVTGDNVTNPFDFNIVNVVRTNEFGSSLGVLQVNWLNLTAPVVDTGDWTADDPADSVDGVLQGDSIASLSFTLSEGERLIITKEWVNDQLQVNTGLGSLEKVYLGVLKDGADTTAVTLGDFAASIRWEGSVSDSCTTPDPTISWDRLLVPAVEHRDSSTTSVLRSTKATFT